MASTKPKYYPSLDANAWVETPIMKLDYLILDFYEAEHSQTYLFKGKVTSLPYILQKNNGDLGATISAIQTELTNYLSKFYDDVVVEVNDHAIESHTGASLRIYAAVQENGVEHKLYNLIKLSGTKLQEVLKVLE